MRVKGVKSLSEVTSYSPTIVKVDEEALKDLVFMRVMVDREYFIWR